MKLNYITNPSTQRLHTSIKKGKKRKETKKEKETNVNKENRREEGKQKGEKQIYQMLQATSDTSELRDHTKLGFEVWNEL